MGIENLIAQGGNNNAIGSYMQGMQARNTMAAQRNALAEQEYQRQQRAQQQAQDRQLNALAPKVYAGDAEATNQALQIAPAKAVELLGARSKADEATKKRMDMQMEAIGNMFTGIERLPIEQRQAAYAQARQWATQNMGIDPAKLPEQYDPAQSQGMIALTQHYTQGKGKFGMQPIYGKDANGNIVIMQMSDAGGIAPVGLPSGVTPVKPLTFRDMGGYDAAYEPLSGAQVGREYKTLGPEKQVSYIAAAEKAKDTASAEAKLSAITKKKAAEAENLLPLIAEAKSVLPSATGSYLGKARDVAGGTVGISTEGAQATARLKVIAGNLKMAQPRMEGPQSDRDSLLYAEMAGQVGDDTLPVETRLAALDQLERLTRKYAGKNNPTPTQSQPGSVKFLGFE